MLPQEATGRPALRQHAVLNALWFVAVTGVQWRLLPREFPPWQTVYAQYVQWRKTGIWDAIWAGLKQPQPQPRIELQL